MVDLHIKPEEMLTLMCRPSLVLVPPARPRASSAACPPQPHPPADRLNSQNPEFGMLKLKCDRLNLQNSEFGMSIFSAFCEDDLLNLSNQEFSMLFGLIFKGGNQLNLDF